VAGPAVTLERREARPHDESLAVAGRSLGVAFEPGAKCLAAQTHRADPEEGRREESKRRHGAKSEQRRHQREREGRAPRVVRHQRSHDAGERVSSNERVVEIEDGHRAHGRIVAGRHRHAAAVAQCAAMRPTTDPLREVWRIDRAGSLDRLTRRREPLPPPGPGEARVAVRAIGLNFADIFACLGLYSATPSGSFVPGLECAGVVEALGPEASPAAPEAGIAVGDRVMVLTRFGGYATALNVPVAYLHPIPPGWSFAEGAAFPVQAITAWYGLVRLGAIETGDLVLVHSAAGGVGLHALAIAEATGATAVATVGHAAKREFLAHERGFPAGRIVVRDRRRFAADLDRVLAHLTRQGFDLVFDAVAGPYFRPAHERLRPEGRHVVYGAADFMPAGTRPNFLRLGLRYARRPRLDPVRMIAENRSVMAFNLIWLWDHVDRLPGAYAETRRLVRAAPHVGATFGFVDVPAAMRLLQSGRSIGKVIVETAP